MPPASAGVLRPAFVFNNLEESGGAGQKPQSAGQGARVQASRRNAAAASGISSCAARPRARKGFASEWREANTSAASKQICRIASGRAEVAPGLPVTAEPEVQEALGPPELGALHFVPRLEQGAGFAAELQGLAGVLFCSLCQRAGVVVNRVAVVPLCVRIRRRKASFMRADGLAGLAAIPEHSTPRCHTLAGGSSRARSPLSALF